MASPKTSETARRDLPVAVGDSIAGKYVVERFIGAGGVGVVVAARHEGLDGTVAIKLLQPTAAESQENLSRFDREARALARIRSEHVARVMDTGALPTGEPYMVMEYLEGQDLAQLMRERGPIPVDEAVDYLIQACEGVTAAHALGIIHRDLKPANIFVTRGHDGAVVVKVLDFGISKLLFGDSSRDQAVTQTLSVIGSPLYMSPEQMERPREADARADVWSLGVLLYELLAAKPPFDAPTLPLLCARICTSPPTPLTSYKPDVPPALLEVIEKCLAKDPAARFQNAADLARALAPFGTARGLEVAEKAARVARSEGLALEGEAPAPDSIRPRRLAWDSSPPPLPPRPRRLARSVALVAGSALIGAIALSALRARTSSPGEAVPRFVAPLLLKAGLNLAVVREATHPAKPAGTTEVARPDAVTQDTARASSASAAPSASASAPPRVRGPRPEKPPKLDDVLTER